MQRLLLALLLCGCAADGGEQVMRAGQPIAGGVDDEDSTAVVAIFGEGNNNLCSGALIAPNVVLTARHCVSTIVGGDIIDCSASTFNLPFDASTFLVTTDSDALNGMYPHSIDEVVLLPDNEDSFCGYDIAILILNENVASSEAKPYDPRIGEELMKGETYSAVGYGAVDGSGNEAGKRRRRDDLTVDCVGAKCGASNVKATEWVGEAGVCSGDSGGPALDSGDRVVGVTSRSSPTCESPVYGYTVSWGQWLKDTVVYASGKGLYDAPDWTEGALVDPTFSMPIGQFCKLDVDCPTSRCFVSPTDSYCTRPCDAENACPIAYSCVAQADQSVCLKVVPQPTGQFQRPDDGCGYSGPSSGVPSWCLLSILALGRRRRG